MLKSWHSTAFSHRYDRESFEAKQLYFEKATHLLHTYKFDTLLHREVWELHADGKSLREIASITGKVSKDGALKIIKQIQVAVRLPREGNG